ncbi:MAG: copper resistance protein B [Methylacidiphilales bacterium]|nr:copper resistance protein B [Candidatus Methylacidiphilales bacterium]
MSPNQVNYSAAISKTLKVYQLGFLITWFVIVSSYTDSTWSEVTPDEHLTHTEHSFSQFSTTSFTLDQFVIDLKQPHDLSISFEIQSGTETDYFLLYHDASYSTQGATNEALSELSYGTPLGRHWDIKFGVLTTNQNKANPALMVQFSGLTPGKIDADFSLYLSDNYLGFRQEFSKDISISESVLLSVSLEVLKLKTLLETSGELAFVFPTSLNLNVYLLFSGTKQFTPLNTFDSAIHFGISAVY